MAVAGSKGSASPRSEAVPGMNCATPGAPAGLTETLEGALPPPYEPVEEIDQQTFLPGRGLDDPRKAWPAYCRWRRGATANAGAADAAATAATQRRGRASAPASEFRHRAAGQSRDPLHRPAPPLLQRAAALHASRFPAGQSPPPGERRGHVAASPKAELGRLRAGAIGALTRSSPLQPRE